MKKRAVSFSWFYLVLFILTVTFMLVTVMPDELWSNKQEFFENVDLKAIAPKILKDNTDCKDFNEKGCIENVHKNCYTVYAPSGVDFLDCRLCPKYPTCNIIGGKEMCEKDPCNLDCKWVTGRYAGGYTFVGKCIHDDAFARLNSDLARYEINFAPGFKTVERITETELYIAYTSGVDILIIDKTLKKAYLQLQDEVFAVGQTGKKIPELQEVAQGAIEHFSQTFIY